MESKKIQTSLAKITLAQFEKIKHKDAPFAEYYNFETIDISYAACVVKLPYDVKHTRPGGTICGPAMFALADYSMWLAVMAAIGPIPLAVTTSMNINFLRKPANSHIICKSRLIKIGKTLCVGDCFLYCEGDMDNCEGDADNCEGDVDACAHVSGTYSIPPEKYIKQYMEQNQ